MSPAPPPAPPADLAADHALLVAATRAAGARALADFGTDVEQWRKSPGQPVSSTDLAVNELLKARLMGARPDYAWLSEEDADERPTARAGARRVWVVDPIDGTRAFLKGRREFAISVALVENGAPVAGAVFNPATDEMFEALAPGPARRNGAVITASAARELAGARLGVSRTEMRRADWPGTLPEMVAEPISSVAYKLALVAAGRFDATVTLWPKNEWDAAAGDLLVRAAGGRITDAAGAAIAYDRPDPRISTIVAAGAALHGPLLARLAARGMTGGTRGGRPRGKGR